MNRPLAIDLFCGLGGWSEGLIAAGWHVAGFDLEDMRAQLGEPPITAHHSLVRQDVRTLHGSQFRKARLIVGSSPCTKYSYMAMPWSRAKALAEWYRDPAHPERLVELNELYDAQFRIQREASEAAGRHIPLVVENVRGAIPWVGRSRANFGSFHLWGDVPALMPQPIARHGPSDGNKRTGKTMCFPAGSANPDAVKGRSGKLHWQDEPSDGRKVPGFRFDGSGKSFQSASVEGMKNETGGSWFAIGSPGQKVTGQNPDGRLRPPARVSAEPPTEGRKGAGAGAEWFDGNLCVKSSNSPARKAASAKIAKIPFVLAEWIGRCHLPAVEEMAA